MRSVYEVNSAIQKEKSNLRQSGEGGLAHFAG